MDGMTNLPDRLVREYLGGGYAKGTVDRYASASAVRGLYRFAAAEGWIPADPGALVRMPARLRYSTGTWLTRDETIRMADTAERDPDPRVAALFLLLVLTGLRQGEALALDAGSIAMYGDARVLDVTRKRAGGVAYVQRLRLPDRAWDAIDRMLGKRGDGPLFLSAARRRLDDNAAGRLISNLALAAGVDKRITAHSLRRTFCTLSLDAGIAPRDIMASANWSGMQMLRRYDCERAAVDRQAGVALEAWLSGGAPD